MENKTQQLIEGELTESLRSMGRSFLLRESVVGQYSSTFIDFISSDSLGLRRDKRLLKAAVECGQKYGAGAGASRVVYNENSTLAALETKVAALANFPNSAFFPTGFTANLAFFQALRKLKPRIKIFIDHRAHASLMLAVKESQLDFSYFKHADYAQLERLLSKNTSEEKGALIIVESLHSMDGTWEDAAALSQLCDRHSAALYVDEAHSFGVTGVHGAGWLTLHPELHKHTVALMLGCGKAVGVQGGFLCTSHHMRRYIRNASPSYIYTTGASPLVVGAVACAIDILSSDEGELKREKLWKNVDYLKKNYLSSATSPIVSFPVGEAKKALEIQAKCLRQGFAIKAMRPPTVPRGTSRLRIVLKECHRPRDIEKLMGILQNSD